MRRILDREGQNGQTAGPISVTHIRSNEFIYRFAGLAFCEEHSILKDIEERSESLNLIKSREMLDNFEKLSAGNYEQVAQESMTARQRERSERREDSFKSIESKTGSFGRLEILEGRDPNGRLVTLMVGDIKGHYISLKHDGQLGPVAGGRLSHDQYFMGTVDGEDLSMTEAKALWVKYAGMAFVEGKKETQKRRNAKIARKEIVEFLLE
jgi:hypothetical protein